MLNYLGIAPDLAGAGAGVDWLGGADGAGAGVVAGLLLGGGGVLERIVGDRRDIDRGRRNRRTGRRGGGSRREIAGSQVLGRRLGLRVLR